MLSRLRLLRSRRVGPATYRRLMAEHGQNAESALAALPALAKAAKMRDYAPCSVAKAEAELSAGLNTGARPIFLGDTDYPALLAMADDAPPMLWVRGEDCLVQALSHGTGDYEHSVDGHLNAAEEYHPNTSEERIGIGIVGARNASSLGRRMARSLSRDLGAEGMIIVSGLARGVDAEAHGASLDTGTIAVVAGGVDVAYPKENADLMARVAESGLVISEMPPGLHPQARHFPRRNRIIAGLSHALVVVEAAAKSGSLITARDATDLGRDVMAVPGHPFDPRASGCNILIRDGAALVRDAKDVMGALGPTVWMGRSRPTAPDLSTTARTAGAETSGIRNARRARKTEGDRGPETHGASEAQNDARVSILSLLASSPVSEDQLGRDIGLDPAELSRWLTEMELSGEICRAPGGMVSQSH